MGNCMKRQVSDIANVGNRNSKLFDSKSSFKKGSVQDSGLLKNKGEEKKFSIEEQKKIHIEGAQSGQPQKGFEDKQLKYYGAQSAKPSQILNDLGIAVTCKKGLKQEIPNQDDFCIIIDNETRVYGVFDGHGPYGHRCSDYVRQELPEKLKEDELFAANPEDALRQVFLKVHESLLKSCDENEDIDCSLSGTTATVLLHKGTKLFVAHAGNSRAILARKSMGNRLEVIELTRDHLPTNADEKKRIYSCGGEVRRMEGESAHRVFVRGRPFPGLSMSRSIGDSIAQTVGVSCEPEVKKITITPGYDLFVLVCSAGV